MKFKQERGFNPIVITLETEEERDVLYSLLSKTPGSFAGDMIFDMWSALQDVGAVRKELWTGRLIAKEEN